ncbi:MAG: tetratricopeptide repeat protein, partial [Thermoanaerobaculia bacterium]|nr:tetratricopeptide repeat protein [Thermoanaerobaculia bacterium]
AQAGPLFESAKTALSAGRGKNHPEYAACLFSQGCYYARQGKTEQAIAALSEVNSIEQKLVKDGCTYLPERELQLLADKTRRSAAFMNSWLAKQTGSNSTALAALSYDNALFDKGFLLQARLAVDQAVAQADSGTQALFARWKDLQRHLAVQYTSPLHDSAYIAGLETQAGQLEKELTRKAAALGQAQRQPKWPEVQAQLRPGEVALEFVHFQQLFPQATDPETSGYAALLLKPGAKQPEFIPLFEEKQLDSLFDQTSVRKNDYVNNLYAVAERGARPVGKPQKTLYELIWQPLEKEMEDVKTIYFSPSGLLHRLNLGAIPIPVGDESLERPTLADRYRLVQLGSTRTIADYGPEASGPQSSTAASATKWTARPCDGLTPTWLPGIFPTPVA